MNVELNNNESIHNNHQSNNELNSNIHNNNSSNHNISSSTSNSSTSLKQSSSSQQKKSTQPIATTTNVGKSTSSNVSTPPIPSNVNGKSTQQTNLLVQQQQLSQANKLLLLQQGPPVLSPPAVFGMVEAQLYRTNSLYPINFPFIKLLGLKTVVQLSPEVPIKAVTTFLEENNINLIHLGLKAWKADASWKPVTEELIKETLEIVLNYDYYPLMITCTSGINQTGVLVGCLRRLQNWNLTSILVEYQSFTGQNNTRYVNEQFIELFDVDLVTLPNRLPQWFIDQQKMLEDEELENQEEEDQQK